MANKNQQVNCREWQANWLSSGTGHCELAYGQQCWQRALVPAIQSQFKLLTSNNA